MPFSPASLVLRGVDQAVHRGLSAGADVARVTRFLSGRSRFVGREDDVFVATYPRSGTTWVHAMVYYLLHGLDTEFFHISEVAPWWERTLAHRADGVEYLAALSGPRVLKSHARPEWLPKRGRKIYVVRDAGDVARSYFRLYRTHLGFEGTIEEFVERMRRGRVQYGRHADHVNAWSKHRDSVLWLRYETVFSDARKTLSALCAYLGCDADPKLLEAVLDKTAIDSMRSEAHLYDHGGEILFQRGVRRHGFIGSGGSGAGEPPGVAGLRTQLREGSRSRSWRLDKYLR
ncbi:MAG: sulfotransferase domain-containing protein [Myxococcota bacterium]